MSIYHNLFLKYIIEELICHSNLIDLDNHYASVAKCIQWNVHTKDVNNKQGNDLAKDTNMKHVQTYAMSDVSLN